MTSLPRTQPEAKRPSRPAWRPPEALVWLLVMVIVNGVAALLGLWGRAWWALAAANFVLLVLLLEAVSRRVPLRLRWPFERLVIVGFPVLVLVGWELLVSGGVLNARWFPPPSRIGAALWELATSYDRFNRTSLLGRPWLMPQAFADSGWAGVQALFAEAHLWATLGRVFGGFVLGALPGVVLGVVMGVNRTVRLMLDGTLSAIYVIPKIAIFPLMMLLFPNPFGEGPKVAVIAVSAFFLVTISTMAGVRDVDPVYVMAGRNYGANRLQLFWHVMLPAALPIVFSGLRLALGTALIVIVAVEFVRADRGVGYLVYYFWQVGQVPRMYAALFVVMLLGVLLTYGLQGVERALIRWRRDA